MGIVIMMCLRTLLCVASASGLPQYQGYFNYPPQFPQQLPQFRPYPAFFNPNQLLGGQASLPPWLRPQADSTIDNTENTAEVEARFIDNSKNDETEGTDQTAENTDTSKEGTTAADAEAQKALEEYMKFYGTGYGYGTTGGYSGYYSAPTGYTSGYSGYTGYPSYTGAGTGYSGYPAYTGVNSGYSGYPYYTGASNGYSGNSLYHSGSVGSYFG